MKTMAGITFPLFPDIQDPSTCTIRSYTAYGCMDLCPGVSVMPVLFFRKN